MNNVKFNIFSFHKYTIIFYLIIFILGVSGTYAYYAYLYEEESVLVGSVVGVNVDLDVELIVGNNGKLVPMNANALSNALNGVGSTNGACVDNVGNLSCQVYKITIVNHGSRVRHVNGTIELFAKDGDGNVYNNLKWIELEDENTIKSGVFTNGMEESTLVSNLTIESKAVGIWYIAIWLDETNGDQLHTDKGEFGGIVKFESDLLIGDGLVENVLERNAENDMYLNFSETSNASGTNGVYVKNDTTSDSYPIYYWRGSVENNLIFADYCWKMVRTTDTGGLKILYNGVPSNGVCNNTGDATHIGKSKYNSSNNSLAYTGYMYNDTYTWTRKNMTSGTYTYANDVSYANGVYTLIGSTNYPLISNASWANVYSGGLESNHYVCISDGATSCSSVAYIYYTTATYAYYFTLSGGNKIGDAVDSMLGADNEFIDTYNTKNSTVKGLVDQWYLTNIENKGYSSYLEDTIWCNDRTVYDMAGLDPNNGDTTTYVKFNILNRTWHVPSPTLTCARRVDSFTVGNTLGNGKLTYPVGLLTPDEIMLAGGVGGVENDDYYLYNEGNYWSSAPNNFYNNKIVQVYVNSSGLLNGSHIDSTSIGIRPAISLQRGYVIGSGRGSTDDPFIIDAEPILTN